MPTINIDHAQTNLRWCKRAWRDGEMIDLALFLFRKALSQLTMEDISFECQVEIVAAHLGREVAEDLFTYNEQVISSPIAMQAWRDKVSALIIC